mgnify:CR=1 FL=1
MYDLGRSLRSLRENAKLTQEQLAKAIGISRSSLNNYENNFRRPSFETLESYADYFHTDMNSLLGGTSALSETDETILDLFRSLNSEGQHKLLDYALLLCNSGEYSKKDSASCLPA